MVFYRDQWEAEQAADPMSNFFRDYDGKIKRKCIMRSGPYGGFIESTPEWTDYRIRNYLESRRKHFKETHEPNNIQ